MKVLLRTNVPRLGQIGEVVEVKPGYARNYLLPQNLGVEPTEANLKTIEIEKGRHLEEQASRREQLEAKAAMLKGKEVTITARANEEGHLYGSIGPAQIAAALASDGIFVEAEHIALDEPIQQLDKYDVPVRFSPEVTATIHVWVVPAHSVEVPDAAPATESAAADDNEQQADS